MERTAKDAEKGVIGVTEQPCVTGLEMLKEMRRSRRQDKEPVLKRCDDNKINEMLRKVWEREKALYKKTGYYVTAQEVLGFTGSFVLTSNSWNPGIRDSMFGGKSNPEIDGVKYLVGLGVAWGQVEVKIFIPHDSQNIPCAVYSRGRGTKAHDLKCTRDVVESFVAHYNARLDELEA
jgi:hypothetical protein